MGKDEFEKGQTVDQVEAAALTELRAQNSNFDNLIAESKASGLKLAPAVICSTDFFSKDFSGFCLNPNDVDNQKIVESFVDQLDSSLIDQYYLSAFGSSVDLHSKKCF